MRCPSCNASWQLPPSTKTQLSACPFCGAALIAKLSFTSKSISDVLLEICNQFGIESLRDGSKTVAIFSDLAPHLKKERILLSYLIQLNGHTKLLSMVGQESSTQVHIYNGVVKSLSEELFISKTAAKHVCVEFSKAIGVNISLEISDLKESAIPHPTDTASPLQSATKQQFVRISGAVGKNSNSTHLLLDDSPHTTNQLGPNVKQIRSYTQYLMALEYYFVLHGKVKLSHQQVKKFIATNRLDVEWEITTQDVEKDLCTIYAKYSVQQPIPTAISLPSTSTKEMPVRIQTYNTYMRALEMLFSENGNQMLTTKQIQSFINRYTLWINFRITTSDVERGLQTIFR